MKKMKVSILALSVLVGGAVFASAETKLTLASTSDVVLTNAVPIVWSDVGSLPSSAFLVNTGAQAVSYGAETVYTDSGGKVSGVANLIKTYYSGTNPIAASSWYVTVKGNITASQMGTPTVKLAIKGQGYTAPSVSNQVLVVNNKSDSAFPGSLNLNFTANKTIVVNLSTNTDLLSPYYGEVTGHIIGNLKGSVKPGLAAVNAKTIPINETADLLVTFNRMGQLDMRVMVFGNKFAAILKETDASGLGNISKNNGTYTLNLKSAGGGSSSLQVKGTIVALPTADTNVIVSTINTATIKGKIQGQAVQSTSYGWHGFESSAQPPAGVTANFTWTASQRTITFVNTSTEATSYLWDLGDGTTSTATTPAPHQYAGTSQTVTVTLTATGTSGTSTKTQTVTFPPPPAQ